MVILQLQTKKNKKLVDDLISKKFVHVYKPPRKTQANLGFYTTCAKLVSPERCITSSYFLDTNSNFDRVLLEHSGPETTNNKAEIQK